MARYTLLPGKKHQYHDGKTARQLQPGDTVELSDKAYEALADKFVPEGTTVSKDDLESMRKRAEAAEAELAKMKEAQAAKERAADTQSQATGDANAPKQTTSTAPTVTKTQDSNAKG